MKNIQYKASVNSEIFFKSFLKEAVKFQFPSIQFVYLQTRRTYSDHICAFL